MRFQRNVVVTRVDKDHLHLAKTLFSSAHFNAGWPGDFLLLTHEVPNTHLHWFRQRNIHTSSCKPLYRVGNWSAYAASKLYLFQRPMKKWGKVIYLDPDIIVRAPLQQLILHDGYFVTQDLGFQPLFYQLRLESESDWDTFTSFEKQMGKTYDLTTPSFNVGVIAFSTNIIQVDTFTRLEEILRLTKDICRHGEQTAQNLYFYKQWTRLPLVYNLLPSLYINRYHMQRRTIKAINLHFAGTNEEAKPDHPTNEYYQEWKRIFDQSILAHWRKPLRPEKSWSPGTIRFYEMYYSIRRFRYTPFMCLFYKTQIYINRMKHFLKKYFPDSYHHLKSIKSWIRFSFPKPWYLQ